MNRMRFGGGGGQMLYIHTHTYIHVYKKKTTCGGIYRNVLQRKIEEQSKPAIWCIQKEPHIYLLLMVL